MNGQLPHIASMTKQLESTVLCACPRILFIDGLWVVCCEISRAFMLYIVVANQYKCAWDRLMLT